MKENEFLKKFITECESLHRIQNAMRRRMDEICVQGAAKIKNKRIMMQYPGLKPKRVDECTLVWLSKKAALIICGSMFKQSMKNSVGKIGKKGTTQTAE